MQNSRRKVWLVCPRVREGGAAGLERSVVGGVGGGDEIRKRVQQRMQSLAGHCEDCDFGLE